MIVAGMRMVRLTVSLSLAAFGVAGSLGTLRTVMYAAALKWMLPRTDRERIVASVAAALAADGY